MAEGFSKLFGTSFDDPRTLGILGLAGGLLEAGGYQSQPMTLGQALSYGGRQGMQSYQTALEAQRAEADRKLREQQLKQSMEIQAAQEARSAEAVRAKKASDLALTRGVTGSIIGDQPLMSAQLTPEQTRLASLAQSPELASLIGQQQVERLTEEKDPFTLSPKQETVTINGKQGTALVQYFPIGSPYIKTLGGDPLTGRVVLSDTFVPAEEKIPETSTNFINVYDENSDFVGSFRADDPGIDEFLKNNPGARVVETTSLTGTEKDIGLTQKTQGAMEAKIFDLGENISRLNEIESSFKPEFLEVATVASVVKASLKDRIGQASPEEKELLTEYTTWKTSAYNQINQYIKAITGAQMSEAEAKRIMKAVPNPSIFEGGPTEYLAQLNVALRDAKNAIRRAAYFKQKGLTPVKTDDPDENLKFIENDRVIQINDMPEIMKKEQDRLYDEFEANPIEGMKPEDYVRLNLTRIFAI